MSSKEPNNRQQVVTPFQDERHAHADCLQTALAAAEALCTQRGLRLTALRRRVLELVWQSHEPVKAYDVLDKLRAEHRGAAPPTVYRALEFLQAEGLVHRIESLNAFIGCGAPQQSHDGQFLICRGCGAVAEIDDAEITHLLTRKAHTLGFQIDDETIEIRGLCGGCRNTG
ncbi:Fur family zinc uptake transcriptional regulator [Methylohalomonas lacus]|uniref:Fur family zinc uptake transcriptional regulator n=1 Tax=Methylohalomonas lacus TaxID=398773 RepID=A0AAE3L1V8_9GAMM|nr:Fur family transcriptional regulator [Methylohalomonas lacus]MCS3904614.1 Fur family zinc uptake transcriptional regulator [Methylohalomonas lacus]